MKKIILVICLMAAFAIIGNSQTASVRNEIRRQTCADASIKVVKIGPGKAGYVASCARNAYEDVYLFEKTRLILEAGGTLSFSKTATSGYYNAIVTGHSGCCTGIKTFHKWNGSRYAQSKCEEFDLERSGWRNPRPCS